MTMSTQEVSNIVQEQTDYESINGDRDKTNGSDEVLQGLVDGPQSEEKKHDILISTEGPGKGEASGLSVAKDTENNTLKSEILSKAADGPLSSYGTGNAPNGQIKVPEKTGILRNTNSEPIIVITSHTKAATSYSLGTFRSKLDNLWSTQEFVNPAFELDETSIPSHLSFADIVQQTLNQECPDPEVNYTHPFGRGNLYTAVLLGEKTKVHSSGGMLAFWVAFILLVVGLAGAIIFMAEMYRANERAVGAINSTAVIQ